MVPIGTVGDFPGFHHALNSFSWSEQNHTFLSEKNFAAMLKKLLRKYGIVHLADFISLSFSFNICFWGMYGKDWKRTINTFSKHNMTVFLESKPRKKAEKIPEMQLLKHRNFLQFTKKWQEKNTPKMKVKVHCTLYPNPSEPLWFHLT